MKNLNIGQIVYLKSDNSKTPLLVENLEKDENIFIVHLVWMAPAKKLIRDTLPGECLTDQPPE